jgi:hypothetical protein
MLNLIHNFSCFIFLNYESSLKDFHQLGIFIKKVKMALWLTLVVSLFLMPLYWSLIINKNNLRRAAINYAKDVNRPNL